MKALLPLFSRPSHYLGTEINSVHKDLKTVRAHVALAFPDLYEVAMSYLGQKILYDIVNATDYFCAERVFAPTEDVAEVLRSHDTLLATLESDTPLKDLDGVLFSITHELCYTNVLYMLDLGGIPLRAAQRVNGHPLVIAGGGCTFNAEPLAAFVDVMVLGDGEEVLPEMLELIALGKDEGWSRSELISRLAGIPGVYVPSFFEDDGSGAMRPLDGARPQVEKRIVMDMNKISFPTRQIVPFGKPVHDRYSVEIARGCTRGCRFCHAGMVNRPIRERPINEILTALRAGLDQTGYEEVSLLSLSSSDYTNIIPLIEGLRALLEEQQVNITLPSLRIESFTEDLMDVLQSLSPGGGFTIAPEAGTERLRNIINKPISDAELMDTVRSVFKHGWKSLKLYFMIGHPQETDEDVAAIAELCKAILQEGKRIAGGRTHVHAGISTFIPKPHTPFQWVGFNDTETIARKIAILHEGMHGSKIKMTWNNPEASLLESWLSRGDRRLADVIFHAWQNGARFDAWTDQFNPEHWRKAFAQTGVDPDYYSYRARGLDEVLPWDHINAGVHKAFLQKDYEWSQTGQTRPDCRGGCYSCGILSNFNELRLLAPDGGWKCP